MTEIASVTTPIYPGQTATITGVGFGTTAGVVRIGVVEQNVISWVDTEIQYVVTLGGTRYNQDIPLFVTLPSNAPTVTALYSLGELGAWFDPSDMTTLFTDTGGLNLVTSDGDRVRLMRDKSGNGNDALVLPGDTAPVYRTDGILSWLETTGAESFYFPMIPLSGNVYYGAATVVTGGLSSYRAVYSGRGDNTAGDILYASSNNDWDYWTGDGSFSRLIGSGVVTGVPAVVVFGRSATTGQTLDVNGAVVTKTGSVAVASGVNRLLGGDDTGQPAGFKFVGKFFSFVMVARVLTTTEITDLKQYLAGQAGV